MSVTLKTLCHNGNSNQEDNKQIDSNMEYIPYVITRENIIYHFSERGLANMVSSILIEIENKFNYSSRQSDPIFK
eukprot:15356677-Ditylum_brightwellii.AAC.1